jgi:hypothetical protein|tara:strand:+ start:416 stop:658 length:243 start_codon:yes stop_codon:yes gene_type:complete
VTTRKKRSLGEAQRERANRPPFAPQLKPEMIVTSLLLLGGKKLGIDYDLPEVLAFSSVAFAFSMIICMIAWWRRSYRSLS